MNRCKICNSKCAELLCVPCQDIVVIENIKMGKWKKIEVEDHFIAGTTIVFCKRVEDVGIILMASLNFRGRERFDIMVQGNRDLESNNEYSDVTLDKVLETLKNNINK